MTCVKGVEVRTFVTEPRRDCLVGLTVRRRFLRHMRAPSARLELPS